MIENWDGKRLIGMHVYVHAELSLKAKLNIYDDVYFGVSSYKPPVRFFNASGFRRILRLNTINRATTQEAMDRLTDRKKTMILSFEDAVKSIDWDQYMD